ncbi:MATE family efflux transporter [Thalassospira alkalitolerans]|uniref:Multidrug transporter MatE n=1 Tax=Thalassospira alkalitolerans TaxID=1293890 RepID=A0A1Y2LC42_9PROT|nr:MATE family efflux transporter [Thalassospira alkalitolerans]OSQ48318.1 multidrug transporter MatE [Thalassospira alkalitolerans]
MSRRRRWFGKGDRRVLALTLPIILSNATVPLLGAVDTAVVGHLDSPHYIGAVAIGALIFSYVFWGFGFLRMATTGLAAQAHGRRDANGVRAVFARAALIAVGAGLLVMVLQWPIIELAMSLIAPSPAVEASARDYFHIRIWASPATLMQYCMLGWLLAMRDTRAVFIFQVVLNSLNMILDILFVQGFGWDVSGVAGATVIADYSGVVLGWFLMQPHLKRLGGTWRGIGVFDRAQIARLMKINGDIFVRTMALTSAFALFTSFSARFGEVTLAANAVLQNFLVFGSFALDGFAHAAETLVGQAYGAERRKQFLWAVRKTTVWAIVSAVVMAIVFGLAGPWIIDGLTTIPEVREASYRYLIWAVILPVTGVLGFQFDGVFLGAMQTKHWRNMMLLSVVLYAGLAWGAVMCDSNHLLWAALNVFFLLRGVTLALLFPTIIPQKRMAGA